MTKEDTLYTEIGTKRIVNRFKLQPKFFNSVKIDIDSLLSYSIKTKECYQYRYFLTALSNMYTFRLASMIRQKLNTEEQQQILLFGRVLKQKILTELTDSYIRELCNDFAQHIFYDITYDKGNKNWLPHIDNIPISLLKVVNSCSLNIYDE